VLDGFASIVQKSNPRLPCHRLTLEAVDASVCSEPAFPLAQVAAFGFEGFARRRAAVDASLLCTFSALPCWKSNHSCGASSCSFCFWCFRRPGGKAKQSADAQRARQDATLVLMKALPNLLRRHQTDPIRVRGHAPYGSMPHVPLLGVPPCAEARWHTFRMSRLSSHQFLGLAIGQHSADGPNLSHQPELEALALVALHDADENASRQIAAAT
jgi:hypothetical protein